MIILWSMAFMAVVTGIYWHRRATAITREAIPDNDDHIVVRRVAGLEAFKALKQVWNGVLEKSGSRSIFLSWEWLYYWWLHFNDGKQLCILVAEKKPGGAVIGIAPFCTDVAGLLGTRRVKFLGTEHVGSDFLDFIMLPGYEQEVVRAFYRYLSRHRREWDIIEISDIDQGSQTVSGLADVCGRYVMLRIEKGVCPYIKLPGSYDDYLRSLTVKMRGELKRKTKYIESRLQAEFVILEEQRDIMERLPEVFTLHDDGFQLKKYGRGAASAFTSDRAKEFHGNVVPSLAENKWLKLCLLNYRGKPIACSYLFHYKNNLFAYQTGFDSSWRKWSPGTVLTGYCIKEGIKNGSGEFHYLRGAESYKARWAKTSVGIVRLVIANWTVRGQCYAASAGIKKILKKTVPAAEVLRRVIRSSREN